MHEMWLWFTVRLDSDISSSVRRCSPWHTSRSLFASSLTLPTAPRSVRVSHVGDHNVYIMIINSVIRRSVNLSIILYEHKPDKPLFTDSTQPAIPPGYVHVNRVPACLAGVKAWCVHLYWVAGNTVIPYGK